MKPILDWYDQLPEPIRSQAIENYKNEKRQYCPPQTGSLSSAIFNGFDWQYSPQGHDYWDDIHHKVYLRSGEFDIKK